MKTKLISRIGYSHVFGSTLDYNNILKKLDVDCAMTLLTIINKNENKLYNGNNTEIRFMMNEWLAHSSKNLKDKIVAAYTKLVEKRTNRGQEADLSEIKIVSRLATLRAIQVLLSRRDDSISEFDSQEVTFEKTFFLYLAVNDELTARQDLLFKEWLNKIHHKPSEVRFHLFLGFSHIDLTGESLSKMLGISNSVRA